MALLKPDIQINKVFLIAKKIRDFTKTKGLFLKIEKNKTVIYFPKGMPRTRIEELKFVLKSNFPEENFIFK